MSLVEQERVQTEVTVREVLHRAADLLEEFGWCQGSGGMPHNHADRHHPHCLVGAVARARMDFGEDFRHAYTALAPYANVWPDWIFAWIWNDEPGRTKAEVVARLREAAEAAA